MNDYKEDNTLDVSNPAPRCPVILLLDTSGSMDGAPIEELQSGLEKFLKEVSDDETASMSVELEIITFGNEVKIASAFAPVYEVAEMVPKLRAYGITPLGKALELADSELKKRRRLYKQKGISNYKPWIVLMTDGAPNDKYKRAAASMKRLGEENKLQYIGIGIGEDADMDTLNEILPDYPGPLKLKGLCFKEFFKWLTDSLKSVSASSIADQDNVCLNNLTSWADIAGLPAPVDKEAAE